MAEAYFGGSDEENKQLRELNDKVVSSFSRGTAGSRGIANCRNHTG